MKTYLIVFLSLIAIPFASLAAFNDVDLSATTNVQLTVGGDALNFTVVGGMETVTVSTASFTVGFASGGQSSITVTSSDRKEMAVSGDVTANFSCNANDSTLTVVRGSEQAAVTITVTPSATTCSSGPAGGGGGGAPPPSFSATGVGGIDKALGGSINKEFLSGSLISAIFPGEAAATGFQAQINPKDVAQVAQFPKGVALIGDLLVEIELLSGSQKITLNKDADLALDYKDKQLQGLNWQKDSVKVYRHNPSANKWEALPSGQLVVHSANLIIAKGKIREGGIFALLGSAAIAPAPAVSEVAKPAVPALFKTTLKKGMANADVRILQQFLNSDPDTKVADSGSGSPGSETNFFGSLTEKAVQKFQKKYGIVSSGSPETTGYGLVGPKTKVKLEEVSGGKQTQAVPAAQPAVDEEVKKQELQKQINDLQKLIDSLLQQMKQIQAQGSSY